MESTDLAMLIEELDERIERLRALYEQYFMGIERIEPLVLRKDVERRLWTLRREQIRNTALRFRLHSATQRYNTFQQYWARVCRDIENGTYQRDLNRAIERFGSAATLTAVGRRRQAMVERGLAKRAERVAKHMGTSDSVPPPPRAPSYPAPSDNAKAPMTAASAPAPLPATPFAPLELDIAWGVPEGSPGNASRPNVVARPAARTPAGPPAAPAAAPVAARAPCSASAAAVPSTAALPVRPAPRSLSDERLQELYRAYVEARRRCNEPTTALSYERMATTLRESARKLQAQHAGRSVDFEVVVRNGTAVLRPILRGS